MPNKQSANRIGSVIVFKEGTTLEQAAAALEKIRDVLDLPTTTTAFEPTGAKRVIAGVGSKEVHKMVQKPFQMVDTLHEFNPEWGGPVWYIP